MAGGITDGKNSQIYIIKPDSDQRFKYDSSKNIENGDIVYIIENMEVDSRTKIKDSVLIIHSIVSTLSILLSIAVLQGG